MADLVRPPGCYVATITQGGRSVDVIHRCGSGDCPTNSGG